MIPTLAEYLRRRPEFRWMADGLERFYEFGGDLDEHLGLKPRIGGRHETVQSVKRRTTIQRLVAQLLTTVMGTDTERIETIGALLNGSEKPTNAQAPLVEALRGLRCPTSRSQLRRYVRQIDDYSDVDPHGL